jgi:transposase InsO family protein
MRRECTAGDRRYERLAGISPSHIYNLRQERRYKEEAITIEKTKPVHNSIGERRKPEPNGEPGFLRADTVHQGDFGKQKGVYHTNFVDEVTQWEVIVAVEQISEECMEPALEEAFSLIPFGTGNFHSDNGGEYINDVVHQFLVRWKTKQTKGRPRHSNDNGLAETKNGAIIRKHMGYRHIPQPFAARINVFYREHLIPYLNFHRPCAFPNIEVLPNGKKKVTYPSENYRTPYEKLKSLPNWQTYLRPGITPAMLETQARAKTPNQAAAEMQEAKRKLLKIIGDSGTLPPSLHR